MSWWDDRMRVLSMKGDQPNGFWRQAAHGLLGGLVLAALTVVGFRLDADPAAMAILYVFVVLLQSLWAEIVPAIAVAAAAIMCLDYFFTPPRFGITISHPIDEIAVLTFFATALVVTRLASMVRRSFREIRSLKDQLELVIDTIPSLVWSALPDGTADFLNRGWREYTGLSMDRASGWGWTAAIHPDDLPQLLEEWQAARRSGEPLETEARLRRFDGAHRWYLFRGVPLRGEHGQIVKWHGTNTDIEDRKLAEDAMRRSEHVLREQASLLDLTHDAIFVRDMNEVISYWNRGAEELYGWMREEAVGKVSHELLRTTPPVPLDEIMAELVRTSRWDGELVHIKRDGTQVIVASRWALQKDAQGQPLGALETNNDITGRRQAEDAARRAQAELAHAARVTTMGEMAASIAHEVNQPLSGVVINANACLRWLAASSPNLDEAREALQRIIRDGKRASDVIARVRALSRKTLAEREQLDMNETIRAVVALAQGEVRRSRVALRTDLAGDLAPVVGDRVQLQQVVLNLIMNGIEAMSDVRDRPRMLVIRTEQEADRVRVTVQDSGTGLDAESAGRIFDAFYTTKHGGLGMGLSISRSIVESHGGRLWAVPNDGPGASFQFTV